MRLSWLRPAYGGEAGTQYATVYLDATRADESGAAEVELRWRSAREELSHAGAPESLLEAMGQRATAPTGAEGAHGLALVGNGEAVRLQRVLPHPPARPSASWSPVPHLMPLVRQEMYVVPYALVVVDRHGADITVVGPHGEELESHEEHGSHDVLRKVPVGGWSSARYQRRAEDSWDRNAAEIADELDKIVVRRGIDLVLVAGEPRTASALLEQAAPRVREAAVELQSGSRAAGSSAEAVADEVREIVVKQATRSAVGVLDRFAQERGRGEAAVEGLTAVVDAVRRAQVDALLLHDDPSSTSTLLVGPDPLQLGATPDELSALGVADPKAERADAALLRGLVAIDAEIVLVPPGGPAMQDGIGAVLRYADASTGG